MSGVEGVSGVWLRNIWVPDDVFVFKMCHHNLADALYSRLLEPNKEALLRLNKWSIFWSDAERLAKKLAVKCRSLVALTDQEFVDKYSGPLKKTYIKTLERMVVDEEPNLASWVKIRPFVKVEKYCLYEKLGRIPRPIQPRSLQYRAYVGKYISAIEKDMKAWVIPRQEFPFVAKGCDSAGLAKLFKSKWDRFADPVTFGLDMSKFDATITRKLKRLENIVFGAIPSTELYQACLRAQMMSHTWKLPKGKFRADTINSKATFRCSGDPQTGCGNTLLMAIMVTVVLAKFVIEIFANGDDTNVICERRDLEAILKQLRFLSDFGCSVKLEGSPTSRLEDVFWCQCYLTETTNGWLWIRDWRRVITTILYNPEYNKDIKKKMRTIAYAEAIQNPGQPVVAEVCQWIIVNWKGFGKFRHHQDTLSRLALESKKTLNFSVEPGSRVLFERRYGVSIPQQHSITRDIINTLRSIGEGSTHYEWVGQHHPIGVGLCH